MRPSKGCMTFLGGVATGVVVASAVGFVVVRYVLLATIQVPVVSRNEWGTQPLYRRTGETSVVMTEPFRRWLPGTATFRAGVEVPLLESRKEVEFYVVPDHRAPVPFILDTGAELNFLSWDTLSLFGVPEHVPASGWFTAPKLHAASAEVETTHTSISLGCASGCSSPKRASRRSPTDRVSPQKCQTFNSRRSSWRL